MKILFIPVNSTIFCAFLCGCAQSGNTPLLFGQTQTVGITANGSTTQQAAELTLGYRDFNVALVPVAVSTPSGELIPVRGSVGGQQAGDAYSVLGQFSVDARSQAPSAKLGKFFATGLAAQKLADGFSAQLSNKH
ncbi:hypothetical protein [Methylocella sp.]|uniref:hypothetical protein n=1 Tax=Methylocella sp. TaxID=1978226 RepID=UPI0035B4D51E